MLPAILYGVVPALQESAVATILISVVCQEIARFLFVKLYYFSENALIKKTEVIQTPFNEWSMAISSGE